MKLKPLQLTAVTLAASLALVGCAGDDVAEPAMTAQTTDASTQTQEQDNSTTSDATSDTRVAAMDKQPDNDGFSTDPTEKFGESYGELRTTDIRVGSHAGFDRLVFEFEGTGDPQYHVGYNDDPRQQASGYPLEVPGEAKLELMIHGTSLDMSPDAKYAATKELVLASGNIVEVYNGGTFEADSQYIVGLKNKRPYKVQILHEPTRLIVDFQT